MLLEILNVSHSQLIQPKADNEVKTVYVSQINQLIVVSSCLVNT